MKIGDLVKATWPDGLVCTGYYTGRRRGYVILFDENQKEIVCNKDNVTFTIIEHIPKSKKEKETGECPKGTHKSLDEALACWRCQKASRDALHSRMRENTNG